MTRSQKSPEVALDRERQESVQRAILHVDMDAFYASVEEREQPELVGQPVIVGGSPQGRGVVAAANYEARRFGVHSAMPAAQAVRLCPHAVFIRSRIGFYAEVSRQIRAILNRYTPLVEPLALDEAFLDVTASRRLFGAPRNLAVRIRQEIKSELALVASVGVAPNKFLAKLASDLEKPDGLVVVPPRRVQAFLDPLPVDCLWGVGAVSGELLARLSVGTIAELRRLSEPELTGYFGKWGERLWQLAHGIDEREVVPESDAKSISHETTFDVDIDDEQALRAWLLELTEQVARRLRRQHLYAQTVSIKLRYANFQTITRQETMPTSCNITAVLWQVAAGLLATARAADARPIRLLGMGVSGLSTGAYGQQSLFDESSLRRQRKIDDVVDDVAARFGESALGRGARRT